MLSPGYSCDERGTLKPVQLHVIHDLGGGIARWCRDYCMADEQRTNLILKPFSQSQAMGEGLMLFADTEDTVPLGFWRFASPIPATVDTHPEYREVLTKIVQDYGVDAILVSSLIGHSLDALDTGLPTVLIQHDLYPYCPALHGYFEGVCQTCDANRLAECAERNPFFNPAHQVFTFEARQRVRERFVDLIGHRNLTLVVPSQSVRAHFNRLISRIDPSRFVMIPHGSHPELPPILYSSGNAHEKLRVVVLGMLSVSKGINLLSEGLKPLLEFCEVYLVGAREMGELFRGIPGVHVVSGYSLDELPGILSTIRPHVGLLLSVVPETFSYTLSELFMLGVPPVATNIGSFAERVSPGVTGYLFEPSAMDMLACLRNIHGNRRGLDRIRAHLLVLKVRSASEMVADYHRLLPLPGGASEPAWRCRHRTNGSAKDERVTLALSSSRHWKQIQRLRSTLDMKSKRMDGCLHEAHALQIRLADLDQTYNELAAKYEESRHTLPLRDAEIAALHESTSWRMTRPLRGMGRRIRQGKMLARCLRTILSQPHHMPGRMSALLQAWRKAGIGGIKQTLLQWPEDTNEPREAESVPAAGPIASFAGDDWRQKAFQHYRDSLTDDIRHEILARIRAMPAPPLISVLVPTYNAPETMLREMLDSVLGQIYPHWQLCIADDGSNVPHVRAVLEDYAERDARIKLDFAIENSGVSRATNRALAMAKGDFVVLLDHDDMLEEQALFRVAEAVLEDDPDMLYSDEVLVAEDGETVQHFIFRPAFSLEYLRSHPYIVHLVGFNPGLLRQIGGFDENLRISQDYDLILRASEQAKKITHIPEMLYRWRIHGNSAGHQMIGRVMETSRAILQRHLQRCGEAGEVHDGPSFNYFDVRYPLVPGLKVAIIIPTKNHGDLVRDCIESIERTAGDVVHEIVLVDHASDDFVSLAYFDSLRPRVTLLRYSGPFNFSAINNWAVAQLDGSHTHHLFCNNDIEAIEPGWLERMLELGQKPDIGIVGAKLYYPDRKTIQHAGVVVACCGVAENLGRSRLTSDDPIDLGYIGSLMTNHEVSAVTGACLLIRRSVFEAIGGFDETIAVGYGDVDLCLRVGEKGYRVLFCAHASLLHHESFTRGHSQEDPHPEDSARFLAKWRALFAAGDPYFNPNFSTHSPNWQVDDPLDFELDIHRRSHYKSAVP